MKCMATILVQSGTMDRAKSNLPCVCYFARNSVAANIHHIMIVILVMPV